MPAATAGFDARRFKAMERAGYNRIAARYAAGADTLRAKLNQALLTAAQLAPGQRVLDLASGPGVLAGGAAQQVGSSGLVVASDLAEAMLAEARRSLSNLSPQAGQLRYVATDAEQLCLAERCFDRVLAGLALFAVPHPARAVGEIHRVLAPGGLLALSVWADRASVPLIHCAQDCIARLLPPPKVPRPSVFRLGEAAVLTDLLQRAGFSAIDLQPCDFNCHFADAAAYWQAFLDLAGGAAEALSRLPASTQQRLQDEVSHELSDYRCEDERGGYLLPARCLIAVARRS